MFRSRSLSIPGNVYVIFSIDWLIQAVATFAYLLAIFVAATFYVGMFLYIRSMVNDLKAKLSEFEVFLYRKSKDRILQYGHMLVNEIKFHNEIVQLATITGHIISPVLFYQLVLCAVNTAIFLYVLGLQGLLLNLDALVCLMGILSVLFPTFIYCHLSESLTFKLCSVGLIYYSCAWYCLPIKQQKLIILPIKRAQKEVRMTGLGIVDCSLSIFSSVRD